MLVYLFEYLDRIGFPGAGDLPVYLLSIGCCCHYLPDHIHAVGEEHHKYAQEKTDR